MLIDGAHLTLLYLLAEWAIRIVMIVVIPLRRPPEAARSWLLLVLFLPVPALFLYGLIGRARFPAWRRQRFRDSAPMRERVSQALSAVRAPSNEITALAEKLGGFPPADGNRVAFSTDYEGIVDDMVETIEQAQSSVGLVTYIFADDSTGQKVAEALARAQRRGVAVHVLIDALGSRAWAKRSVVMLQEAGVVARLALPLLLTVLRRTRGDLRNHRKLCLIDGKIGFVGSLNIVDRDFKPGVVNDELVARVEGPAVASLEAVFTTDWFLETGERLPAAPVPDACGVQSVQVMPSGPDYPEPGYERLLVELVHRAVTHVSIVTPYLVPDDALLVAMKNAAARGATVILIVSRVIDQHLVRLAQQSFYAELLQAGILIRRYRDHLLHAKSVSVDGITGLVGSSNADIRSFTLNAEISILINDSATAKRLQEIHLDYAAHSDQLTLSEWDARSKTMRISENLARLVTPLL